MINLKLPENGAKSKSLQVEFSNSSFKIISKSFLELISELSDIPIQRCFPLLALDNRTMRSEKGFNLTNDGTCNNHGGNIGRRNFDTK
jgi:hypothetical protein